MDIQTLYLEILDQLKAGQRPRVRPSKTEIRNLREHFEGILGENNVNPENLRPILCILYYMQNPSEEFAAPLMRAIELPNLDDELLIYVLVAMQKHIIAIKGREGNPVPINLIESLKNLITKSSPEVLEWCLRIAVDLGGQSVKLRSSIEPKFPTFFAALFNSHLRACRRMINELNKKWKNIPRMPL